MNLHLMLRAVHVINIACWGKALVSAESLPMVIWETVYYKSAWSLRTHLCAVVIISTK